MTGVLKVTKVLFLPIDSELVSVKMKAAAGIKIKNKYNSFTNHNSYTTYNSNTS